MFEKIQEVFLDDIKYNLFKRVVCFMIHFINSAYAYYVMDYDQYGALLIGVGTMVLCSYVLDFFKALYDYPGFKREEE